MNFNWHQYPFLRLILPVLGGIIVAYYFDISFQRLVIALSLPIAVILLFSSAKKHLILLFQIIIFGFAYSYTYFYDDLQTANHFHRYLGDGKQQIVVRVLDMPEFGNWTRLLTQVEAKVDSGEQLTQTAGNLLVYIKTDSSTSNIAYGDMLLLTTYANKIAPPKNPDAFDFAAFMRTKNIYYQSFIQNGDWQIVKKEQGSAFFTYLYKTRSRLLRILKTYLPDEDNYGVTASLTLGYRAALGDQISEAYANAGAIHVLAVSGLHVGLIFWLLNLFLNRLPQYNIAQILLKIVLALSGIWLFAFLTGGSPSVMRASIMFSVIVVGKYTFRSGKIYNSLAAAAFISLLWNPYFLFTVGFQLSYLAVLGIVYFQPKIVKIWYADNIIVDYLWQLLCVSLAAQLAVIPISLYYFHQLPVYFWLSSLLAVPAAFAIMVLTILLFISAPISTVIASLFAWILNAILTILNVSVVAINQFPFSTIEAIWLYPIEVLFLYVALVFFALFIQQSKARWLISLLAALAITLSSVGIRKITSERQQELVVYHSSKQTLIDYFDGRERFTFQSDSISEKTIEFTANMHRLARYSQLEKEFTINDSTVWNNKRVYLDFPFVQLGTKRLLLLDTSFSISTTQAIKLDYLLIYGNPKIDLATISTAFEVDTIIFDASNKRWQVAQWMEECKRLGLAAYDVQEEGAFVLRW